MSKCAQDAGKVYASLVVVSLWGQVKDTYKTVYQNGSTDTSFEPTSVCFVKKGVYKVNENK
jgi:hypothetical protein